MPLLVTNSRADRSLNHEDEAVPPLFAGLMREERGDAPCEAALRQAHEEFSEDGFVAGLGKFREALALSRGQAALKQTVRDAAAREATQLMPSHWRVAEALLFEVEEAGGQSAAFNSLWAEIERQKREDTIRVALDESDRAEETEYLPHVRARLWRLAQSYPGDAGLESRLHVLDRMLAQRVEDDREHNLRRLTLFRDRLDETENPETLRGFPALVAPFAHSYAGDVDFANVLNEVNELCAAYENASAFLAEQRSRESLEVCDHALAQRPGNLLFRRLAEKAKGREWVRLLSESTVQRAREFARNGQYAEAAEEWESLRSIDPNYPGLEAELLHCEALKVRAQQPLKEESEPASEVFESDAARETFPSFASLAGSNDFAFGRRIAITEEAWSHLKTGLVATAALLLVLLVLASNAGH
jgi:hypothetical protein